MSRIVYYFVSIFELIFFIRPFTTVLGVFLRLYFAKPANPGIAEEKIIHLPRQGVRFKVRGAMDIWSVKETFLDRFYVRFGTPIGQNWTIVDVGGGIGDFTTFAAQAHPGNVVYAFEPTPGSFSLLQHNLQLNQADNATGYQQAIWSETGILWMDTSVGEPGQFISNPVRPGATPGNNDIGKEYSSEAVTAPCISLAEAFQRHSISHCDLLKMDCEGAEYAILFNTPTEVFAKIQRIIMEYHNQPHGPTYADLRNFLIGQGFAVRVTTNYVHDYLGYLYASRA